MLVTVPALITAWTLDTVMPRRCTRGSCPQGSRPEAVMTIGNPYGVVARTTANLG